MEDIRNNRNAVALGSVVIVSATIVGYFTGLQSPMNPLDRAAAAHVASVPSGRSLADSSVPPGNTVKATRYAEMPAVTASRQTQFQTRLSDLRSKIDPVAKITILPADKAFALERRERNRAFNGAPPTIPHPVDQTNTQACLACHGDGAKLESLVIPRMSHQLLTNCTQCHVESNPRHMTSTVFQENSFVGAAAPTSGPRAFPGAPPQIPHSTWMRSDCMSCHGFTGQQGLRTTHPWRTNCQQCHAVSSELDQTLLTADHRFLSTPTVRRPNSTEETQ